jgi:hypothetical protein
MSVSALGGLLVRFAVGKQRAVELTDELRSIHDEFIRNRDAEASYFRMGFLAAKAIERCRQLEGSDGGVHAGRGAVPGAGVPGDPLAGEGDRPRKRLAAPPAHPRQRRSIDDTDWEWPR